MSASESPSHTSLLEALQDKSYHPVVVMGDGQIAMMLVQECHRLGLPVVVIGNWSSEDARKSSVQAMSHNDYYIDLGANWDISREQGTMVALAEKLKGTDGWVTAEWENVPANLLEFFEKRWVRLAPGKKAFEIMSDKGREKSFFDEQSIRCSEWCRVDNSLTEDKAKKYLPGFLKSCKGGYDSKGQVFVETCDALQEVLKKREDEDWFLPGPHILETKVELAYEMSVVFARDESGKVVIVSTQKNHQDGPLITSVSGAWIIPSEIEKQAIEWAIKAADGLDYLGTGAIEFFVTKDRQLLANEMAPRPHNSGHHTIELQEINQYTLQALIAERSGAVDRILKDGVKWIDASHLVLHWVWESEHYRVKQKNPDMLTMLLNVVWMRENWRFPEDVIVYNPGDERSDVKPNKPILTWYGKLGSKDTKHGHIVVTGTRDEVRVRVKELLEHCYLEEHARYFAAFEKFLSSVA